MVIANRVFERASADPEFRSRLLKNTAAVLAEHGTKLSANTALEVIDVRPNEIHLNLGRNCDAPQFQKVLARAESDGAFRAELLANPKAALEESLGEGLPANVAVHVHDRPRAGVVRLFVPPLRRAAGGELSDAELAGVAGGGFFKNLRTGIGNLLCRDMVAVEINNKNNSYEIMTDPSPGAPTQETGSLIVW